MCLHSRLNEYVCRHGKRTQTFIIFDPAYVHVHGAADILHVSAVVVLVEIDGHSRDKNRCRFVRGRVRRHCQSSRPRYHAAAKISPVEAKNHSVQHFTQGAEELPLHNY